ncbi:uncharacterized protein LOC5563941 [Aedes aegypti]|uniref:Uncharacterized protein n=1 Tax=Aedes aegypti TaxID=7159 RepID=A0A6I8TG04_AEDAE|nr:uncharacterized protein LOC5563941 [Aedes aegypti]
MASNLEKIVSISAPIVIHSQGISVVELFADRHRMPESMLPDVASLMFVTATSMIVTKWLEKNPARLLGHVGDGRGGGVESLVYLLIGVLANVAACDLSLRVLWIPIQYFLRYLKDQQVLVFAIRWMFFYFRYFRFTRHVLISWIKAAHNETGFLFARNLVAAAYLLTTLHALYYFAVVKRLRNLRNKRNHPSMCCDASER